MGKQLPFFEWLAKMAEALDMPFLDLKGLEPKDRSQLLATASGMSYDAFKALGGSAGWEAQVEAIRKHSGSGIEAKLPKVEPKAEPEPKAEAPKEAPKPEAKVEPIKAPPQPKADIGAALGALGTLLEPVVNGIVEQRLAEAVEQLKADGAGQTRTITVKVGDFEPTKIEGHVHPMFDRVLKVAAKGLTPLLVGPAGTGKTTMAKQVAKALNRSFGSVSCTAGMSEGELVGKLLPNENGGFSYRTSQFVTLYENGGVFLVDEIDAADPNVLLKVNSAIGSVRGGGVWHNDLRSEKPEVVQHKDFVLIAAANTFGTGAGVQYVGRNQLDAATLDRFTVIEIDYDRTYEQSVGDSRIVDWMWKVREAANSAKLRRVVSTRSIERGTAMLEAGFSLAEVKELFFAPWTADEKAKVGA